jgi:hypothetical protein
MNVTEINVCATWRDAEGYAERTLACLEKLLNLDNFKFNFYFYENDSVDNTRQILSNWIENKSGELFYEDLGVPKLDSLEPLHKFILLSYCRNKLNQLSMPETDYTLLINTDVIFDHIDFTSLFEKAQTLPMAVMLVANTRDFQSKDLMEETTSDSFYDILTFRDKYFHHGLPFTNCPFLLKEDREAWDKNLPILINAGSGGFSLIRTPVLKQCFWSTVGQPEYVNFCSEISKFGNIMMIPDCKPKAALDLSNVSLENCKKIAKEQAEKMEQINQIFYTSLSSEMTKQDDNE